MNDLPVGRSTDETLRLLQAFQYTDKHEEGKFQFDVEKIEKTF
jgi:alkyl hydroperoxide reductase subunit AhpC